MELNVKSENRKFLAILGILAFGISLRYFDHTMTEYNTTLFAMSYKYGFISRGMLGTIYQGLDALLPFDLMTYQGVYYFTMVMTLVYYLVFFLFLKTCLEIVPEGQRSTMRYLSIFLSIFAFSTFVTEEMYGRLDLYLYTIMYLCLILLLKRRAEWLVLPLGICIYQCCADFGTLILSML